MLKHGIVTPYIDRMVYLNVGWACICIVSDAGGLYSGVFVGGRHWLNHFYFAVKIEELVVPA